MISNNFFILGLPRSRTTWLANLLTWGRTRCHHELTAQCPIHKFPSILGPRDGDSDSGLLLHYEDVMVLYPRAKWLLIERDWHDARESTIKALIRECVPQAPITATETWTKLQGALQDFRSKMEYGLRYLRYDFKDLVNEDVIRDIWRFCLDEPWDQQRYEMLRNCRIEPVIRTKYEVVK